MTCERGRAYIGKPDGWDVGIAMPTPKPSGQGKREMENIW